MKQESLFGSVWQQPELDRGLLICDEFAEAHMRNASEYMSWVIRNYLAGNKDIGTPKHPMKLPAEGRDAPDYEAIREREKNRSRVKRNTREIS